MLSSLASTGVAPPYPPDASPFCPKYHPIHDGNVYDPSGPLQDKSGLWHTWEDDGAWSHWTSRDLVHWDGSFKQSTHFGADTGSVSPTPSGVYAFWPIMSGPGRGAIGSAKATDDSLTNWTHRGPTIPMPARINTGYRDPVRAFSHGGKWWVGVGCGSKEEGAQLCVFEAATDQLLNFTDRGSLYTTNTTFGSVDADIVWQPTNVSANMMECPDLFPLGDKWVLLASLYRTNQWWVGSLAGDPPRFTPERVGVLDYGNGYAAKTGSAWVQSGAARRLLFGFTGWQEPTMPHGCGRALVLPRELRLQGSELQLQPIPEAAVLRTGPVVRSSGDDAPLAAGSQVEIRLQCAWAAAAGPPSRGVTGIRTLASADSAHYTELGYDWQAQAFYADHTKCCNTSSPIVQRAPLPLAMLGPMLNLTLYVDGGLLEAFLAGRVITPLVAPDVAAGGPPEARVSSIVNTAHGVSCSAESWKLAY